MADGGATDAVKSSKTKYWLVPLLRKDVTIWVLGTDAAGACGGYIAFLANPNSDPVLQWYLGFLAGACAFVAMRIWYKRQAN